MRPGPARVCLGLVLLLAACSPGDYAQTPFARAASDAASALSAAALTLEDLHTGKLDRRYAGPSLGIYRALVSETAATLARQRGAPEAPTLRPALDALARAGHVLDAPCLEDGCDWQRQVGILRSARDALLEASR